MMDEVWGKGGCPSPPKIGDETPEQLLGRLWNDGQCPDLDGFLATQGPLTPTQLAALTCVDQYERWLRGERPLAEDYLSKLPIGPEWDEEVCDIVYSEYILREQLGEQPSRDDFLRRFPRCAARLARQWDLHDAFAVPDSGFDSSPDVKWPAIPGYEIKEEIGRGGMGVVYRARQRSLDREVALKVLTIREDDQPIDESLNREGRFTARLMHPRIVQIFDAGQTGSCSYFAMELAQGIDLQRLVARDGPLSVSDALSVLRQAAEALGHAHAAGLIHRDIKPSNIMIGPDGLKLLDLGLAHLMLERPMSGYEDSSSTQGAEGDFASPRWPRTFVGTPDYVAPEQIRDSLRADFRSDLYSLGCTLFFALTGKPPFDKETPFGKLKCHLGGPFPSPLTLRPDLPLGLVEVLARLTATSPEERYASSEELLSRLASLDRPKAPAVRVVLLHRFSAGSDWIKGLAFLHDGRTLATVGLDGRLRLWNSFDARMMWETVLPTSLFCVTVDPRGNWLAVGGEDGSVWLVDATMPSNPPTRLITRPATQPEALATAHTHSHTPSLTLPALPSPRTDNINALGFLHGGEKLLAACHDGMLRLYETTRLTEICRWRAHLGAVWSLDVLPDGHQAITVGQDRRIKRWNLEGLGTDPEALASGVDEWPDLNAVPLSVAVSPDGRRLLVGLADGSVGVWNLADRRLMEMQPAHRWKVTAVAWSPDSLRYLSVGRDRAVRVGQPGTPSGLFEQIEHTNWATCAAWCNRQSIIATGSADRTVCIWRVQP